MSRRDYLKHLGFATSVAMVTANQTKAMSNELTIEQMNEAIALFMGGSSVKEHGGKRYVYYLNSCAKAVAELKYHSSWDCLMPVVEKIETPEIKDDKLMRTGASVSIWYKACVINYESDEDSGDENSETTIQTKGETKHEAVYEAVYQFIQWYNKQKDGVAGI